MKIGDYKHFCCCLFGENSFRDHVTMPDEEGQCVYCGYYALERKVTKHDLNIEKRYGKEIEGLKKQALDLYAKEKIHDKKIN